VPANRARAGSRSSAGSSKGFGDASDEYSKLAEKAIADAARDEATSRQFEKFLADLEAERRHAAEQWSTLPGDRDVAVEPPAAPAGEAEPEHHTRAEQSRINGSKSRGPRTPEGKAASSRNALKHGLRSSAVLLPDEDEAEFKALSAGVMQELAPVGPMQEELARRAAELMWKLRCRVPRIEAFVMSPAVEIQADPAAREGLTIDELLFLDLGREKDGITLRLQRYETRIERSLQACLRQLRMLQAAAKERASQAPKDAVSGSFGKAADSPAAPSDPKVAGTLGVPSADHQVPSADHQVPSADHRVPSPNPLPISGSFGKTAHVVPAPSEGAPDDPKSTSAPRHPDLREYAQIPA